MIVETESSKEPVGAETLRLVGPDDIGDEMTLTERDLKFNRMPQFQNKDTRMSEDVISNLAIVSEKLLGEKIGEKLGLAAMMKKTPNIGRI